MKGEWSDCVGPRDIS